MLVTPPNKWVKLTCVHLFKYMLPPYLMVQIVRCKYSFSVALYSISVLIAFGTIKTSHQHLEFTTQHE